MPRYFFHRTDGTDDRDEEGVVLPNLDVARIQAVIFAGETLKDNPSRVWDGHDLQIEVTDENYLILFTVSISTTQAPKSSDVAA